MLQITSERFIVKFPEQGRICFQTIQIFSHWNMLISKQTLSIS